MQIILLSGKAEGGKTTVSQMIKEILESKDKTVLKMAYGDLLKYLCGKYFNWDGNKDVKGREILQQIGTNTIRAENPNYWVDFVIGFVELFETKYDYVIVDDCRFKNELERWDHSWDTTTLRVSRSNHISSLTPIQLQHPSEIALDDYNFDYYINSKDDDLDKLEVEVNKFIKYMEAN